MERNVVHGAIGATYTPFEANGVIFQARSANPSN
jgi:hypothetical protein